MIKNGPLTENSNVVEAWHTIILPVLLQKRKRKQTNFNF